MSLEQSTIHGIRDLVLSDSRLARVFWTAVLLVCAGILAYSCTRMAIDFEETPMVTNIKTVYLKEFPPIMFCPRGFLVKPNLSTLFNLVNTTETEEEELFLFLNDYFVETHTTGYRFEEKSNSSPRTHGLFSQILAATRMSHIQIFQKVANSINFTVGSAIASERGENSQGLTLSVAPPIGITRYGICFKFTTEVQTSHGTPPTHRSFSLPAMQSLVPPSLKRFYTYGMVFLGEEVKSFYPLMPIYIHDNNNNFVQLTQTQVVFKNFRTNPCVDRYPYQMAEDVFSCYDRVSRANAGCAYIRNLSAESSVTPCHQAYDFDKLFPTASGFMDCVNSHTEKVQCKQNFYEASVMTIPLTPTVKDLTGVTLLYHTGTYSSIEEEHAYSWQVFLSNIGGTVSLVCGASVVSIAQLLYVAGERFIKFCSYSKPVGIPIGSSLDEVVTFGDGLASEHPGTAKIRTPLQSTV